MNNSQPYLHVKQLWVFLICLISFSAYTQDDPQFDLDSDGCVGASDILLVLGEYGTCQDTTPTLCLDSLEYWGFWYDLVEIGDQCWFAENLQSDRFRNGDTIPGKIGNWNNEPHTTFYGEGGLQDCVVWYPEPMFCPDTIDFLGIYGRLYNWYAASDPRELCPAGWRTPTESDFLLLKSSVETGADLKSNTFWANDSQGTNASGFNGLPAGKYNDYEAWSYSELYEFARWWSSSSECYNAGWILGLNSLGYGIFVEPNGVQQGYSVRCIMDE